MSENKSTFYPERVTLKVQYRKQINVTTLKAKGQCIKGKTSFSDLNLLSVDL